MIGKMGALKERQARNILQMHHTAIRRQASGELKMLKIFQRRKYRPLRFNRPLRVHLQPKINGFQFLQVLEVFQRTNFTIRKVQLGKISQCKETVRISDITRVENELVQIRPGKRISIDKKATQFKKLEALGQF